jgi:hypothetical protein
MTLQSDILLFRLKPWPDSSPPCFDELGVDGRDEERMLANLKKTERRSRNRRDPDARFCRGLRK